MGARRLLVVVLGTTLLVTPLPRLGVRWIDRGGIASARIRETFREPPVWRSEGGVLRRNLEMRRAATKLGHRKILTLTYAGAIPGPTWRIKPGDRIQVRLINNMTPSAPAPPLARLPLRHDHGLDGALAMETPPSFFTNLHVHGLQVDPLTIRPGETQRWRIVNGAAHRAPARVIVGRRVEIQLPAAPTEWTPSIDGTALRRRGDVTDYPSVGQYDGTSAIVSVPFKAVRRGAATVALGGIPAPPTWLENPYVLDLDSR